ADVNSAQVNRATPISTTDIGTSVATELTDIGLDHLLSAAVTGTDVANDSIIAKLVSGSATADWDDYTNTTDSLAALNDDLDSIITLSTPPPGDVDLSDFIQDFVVASGSTPRSVVITVSAGDDAIPSNFWKDHMAVFYDATLSSDRGAQWRKIIGNTASSSGTVTLRLDKALDFTPADTTDYVYIVGLDQVAEGYVR
ncbi:MAG: hypothetical protein PHC52_12900, partial [Syntrophales bacterium]|nr:hypothetical protein [Syntrophales bacterium]